MTRSTARSDGAESSTGSGPSPEKKAAPRKRPAERSGQRSAPRKAAGGNGSVRTSAAEVAGRASAQLLELTGKAAEGVVGISRTEDGWTVQVEVLELRRIPSTTDVLAAYEVTVSEDGDLVGYRRLGRYVRGKGGEDG